MNQKLNAALNLILDRQTAFEIIADGFHKACDAVPDDDPRRLHIRRVAKLAIEIANDRIRGIQLATAREDYSPYEDDSEDVKQEYALIRAILDRAPEPVARQARRSRGQASQA